MEKYLAFDTSGEEIVVGAYNGKKYAELRMQASGTENLLPLVDNVLKSLKMKIGEVEALCVGVGPGSWTGSRVAVVTAFGLKAGNPNLKLFDFNSFELISYNDNNKKKVLKVVKAYANFVYAQNLMSGEILAITKDELNSTYASFKLVGTSTFLEGIEVASIDLKKIAEEKIKTEKPKEVDEIEPMYLRLSQAEYQKLKKEGK